MKDLEAQIALLNYRLSMLENKRQPLSTFHLTITHTSRTSVNVDAANITEALSMASNFVKQRSIVMVEADLIRDEDASC